MDYVRLVKVKLVESRFPSSKRSSFTDTSFGKHDHTSMNFSGIKTGNIIEIPSPRQHKPSSLVSQSREMKPKDERIGHGRLVVSRWDRLLSIISDGEKTHVNVDGVSLDIANVVAVARYGSTPLAGENVFSGMDKSSDFMKSCLADGHTIYGVNTGFGGNANTHTDKVERLQSNLISFLNCGVIGAAPETNASNEMKDHAMNAHAQNGHASHQTNTRHTDPSIFKNALPNEDPVSSSVMPESWVRATLLIRTNTLSCGHSGVRPALVNSLVRLLRDNVTPLIPLRGSISASGDLIPLSYVAGTLQGSPGVEVYVNDGADGRKRVTADVALCNSLLSPLQLGPKEGLAIVNGTAVSAGVGSLALHDAHSLIILSQILTAMGVESLRGSNESFEPFFSKCRPHAGQAEAARNIRGFLKGSALLSDKEQDHAESDSLRQDRYSIRTTPQWLGPQLENLMLADKQISIEVNSTTDNPIIDAANERILHGGNFQAMSVTSAMEKTRSVLQAIGRMLFSQCTELINPVFSNGLPPNLTADEPSQNFLLKGIDINVASLQAELGLLTAPVEPHVQNAEMGNQSLNSLALLSARYTHTALNILSQMSAAYLLTLCQALDLRALHYHFLDNLEPDFKQLLTRSFAPFMNNLDLLHRSVWIEFKKSMANTTATDSSERFIHITENLQSKILIHAASHTKKDAGLIAALRQWTDKCSKLALQTHRSTRTTYTRNPDATEFLGRASTRMYKFVRFTLRVPFQISTPETTGTVSADVAYGPNSTTIGALVTKIHTAIQNGSLYIPVMECMREVEAEG